MGMRTAHAAPANVCLVWNARMLGTAHAAPENVCLVWNAQMLGTLYAAPQLQKAT